jgi:hypothetical protein
MKAEFSEFSYGFALAYEIGSALWPRIRGVPLFPSLIAEADKGFDISFVPSGTPLFLQFKLADYMKTKRAKYWSDHGRPYFRLAIHPPTGSDQHNLLRELSKREQDVYYVAPAFWRERDFNACFKSNGIIRASMCIPIADLPDLVDSQQHHITYCPGQRGFVWHSTQGERYQTIIAGDQWLPALAERATRPRNLGKGYFIDLRRYLVDIIRVATAQPELLELPVNLVDTTPVAVIRDLRFLLLAHFGVEMIVLVPQ